MTQPSELTGLYIGLMSGTSLDGIDTAIVDFSQAQPAVLHCSTTAYPEKVRDKLRRLNYGEDLNFDSLYQLDVELGELYAEAVARALANSDLRSQQIRAIGCHGQTLQHNPDGNLPYTAQIGDPNVIAARTAIDTVADFRRKDIALGGQGAPLAPLFHNFLFADADESRVVVNIGGIANISCLDASRSETTGFDTGPGNTLMDYWIAKHLNTAFDDEGKWAASGTSRDTLLTSMISDETYFKAAPPKTTGTEFFSPDWLEKHNPGDYRAEDVQATLCELTAITITEAIKESLPSCVKCYVCGGGARNKHLLKRLQHHLGSCSATTTETLGINPEFVEAIGFAWLARQRLHGEAVDLPPVTGSRSPSVLGGLYSGR